MDDVFIIGSLEETVNAFQDLQCQSESTGLLVSKQKCEAYAMAYPDEWSVDIAINASGIDTFGTCIGTPDYVSARCIDKAKSGTKLCSKLLELADPQSSLLLLRQKLNARAIMKNLNIVQGGFISDDELRRVQASPH